MAVHVFYVIYVLSHKSLICMEDRDHYMHGYSRHSVINGITRSLSVQRNTCITKLTKEKLYCTMHVVSSWMELRSYSSLLDELLTNMQLPYQLAVIIHNEFFKISLIARLYRCSRVSKFLLYCNYSLVLHKHRSTANYEVL